MDVRVHLAGIRFLGRAEASEEAIAPATVARSLTQSCVDPFLAFGG